MFCCARTAPTSRSAISGVSAPNLHQLVERVTAGELPNRQRGTGDRTRREHRGHARAVLEPRVEQRLHVGDLVPAGARDVLDGDGQIPRLERSIGDRLNRAVALDEDTAAAVVDHHLGDGRIDEQILDRFQERQNAIEAAHSAPLVDVIEVAGVGVQVVRLQVAELRRQRVEPVIRESRSAWPFCSSVNTRGGKMYS